MQKVWRILWPKSLWGWVWRGGLFMVISMVGSVEMTSQSWFCNSCHIMNSYYTSWRVGTHKEVECVKCHIAPGMVNFVSAKLNGAGQVVDDLLSRTSTKPSASVSDFSCTRSGCHDLAKVRSSSRREGKFFFDHGKHLDLEHQGIEVHCTTCHSHIQGSQHFELNTNACITCHLVKGKTPAQPVHLATSSQTKPAAKTPPSQCANCHNPPDRPIMYQGLRVVHAEYLAYGASCESCHRGVTAPPQPVKDDQCFSCHDFGIEKLGSVEETHRVHSQGRHKVECFSCHGVTRHGPSAQSMRLDQIDCQSCHQGQHAIQQTTYKSGTTSPHQVPDTTAVTPMFLAHVNCTGCHTKPRPLSMKAESGASVATAVAEACDNCHKPGLGQQMIPMWQKNTRELYDLVAKMVPATSQDQLSPQAQQLVKDAKKLLEVVKLDGSWGVHNPRYTQKLLEEAKQKLQEAQQSLQPKAGGTR